MKNSITSKMVLSATVCFVLIAPLNQQAAAQSRQIRVSEFCEVVGKELRAKIGSSLYKLALEKKKSGKLRRKSRERLEDVEYWRSAMRSQKCKNIP